MADPKSAMELVKQIQNCPNGMCGHCIEILCEELEPAILAQEKRIEEARQLSHGYIAMFCRVYDILTGGKLDPEEFTDLRHRDVLDAAQEAKERIASLEAENASLKSDWEQMCRGHAKLWVEVERLREKKA